MVRAHFCHRGQQASSFDLIETGRLRQYLAGRQVRTTSFVSETPAGSLCHPSCRRKHRRRVKQRRSALVAMSRQHSYNRAIQEGAVLHRDTPKNDGGREPSLRRRSAWKCRLVRAAAASFEVGYRLGRLVDRVYNPFVFRGYEFLGGNLLKQVVYIE
jgi:hypothetical protein